MIYGDAVTELPIGGNKTDYRIKVLNGNSWIEIEPEGQNKMIIVESVDLTTFIDELMEIRDYINTHTEFQGGSEE